MRVIKLYALIAIILFLIGAAVACSSGNPVTPGAHEEFSKSDQFTPILVSEWDSNGNPKTGVGLLGLFQLSISQDPLSVDLVPLRSAGLKDSLEVIDITNFLTLVPCRDCVKMRSVGLDTDGHLVMSIGIKHPFPAGNPLLQISGKNRIDLHVFNVEGVLVIAGGLSPELTFPGIDKTINKNRLLNSSGYTSYLASSLNTILSTPANVHPYILHFRDYTTGNYQPGLSETGFIDVFHPSGNLIMAQGCDYDYRDYILSIEPGLAYEYLFAVECSYGVSTESFLDRFTPEYRIPQYNKKAASEISVEIKDNLLIEGVTTGTATVEVKVLDMNHGVEVSDFINKMNHDSSVKEIRVEIPALSGSAFEVLDPTTVFIGGSPRDPSDPLKYDIQVLNLAGASRGKYLGLVEVVDSFPVGVNTHPYLAGRDGGNRVPVGYSALTGLFNIDKFATYQVFEIEVLPSLTFTSKLAMPNPRSYTGAAVVGDKIYVVGGYLGISPADPRSDDIDEYDPIANTWNTSLAPMPTARAGLAVEAVDGKIYAIGGQLAGGASTDVMEIYDVAGDSWTPGSALPGPFRHGMASCEKDGIIYIAGGYNLASKEQNSFFRYNTTGGGWGALADMVAKRTQFALTVKGDFIYAVGGNPVVGPGSDLTPLIEVYDIVNLSWAYPTSMPSIQDIAPTGYKSILSSKFETLGTDIVMVGGAYDTDLLEPKAYVYNDTAETFSMVGQILVPRILFSSVVYNDKLYLFGGVTLAPGDPPPPILTATVEEGSW